MAKINLKEQLQKRVDALEALLDQNEPLPGNSVPPTSMNQARDWAVPELGIVEIASKSSTNQKQHKNNDEILDLLGKLDDLTGRALVLKQSKKRVPKPKPKTELIRLAKENKELKLREEGLSNRLHEVEHAHDSLKSRFENQRLRLSKSTELIASLRRQINADALASKARPHLSLATHEANQTIPTDSE